MWGVYAMACVEVRAQFCGVSYPLPSSCGFQGLSSGCQACSASVLTCWPTSPAIHLSFWERLSRWNRADLVRLADKQALRSLLIWLPQCWNYKHVALCSLLAFYWILFPDIKGLIFFFLDWTYWQGLESNIANTLHIHLWGLTPLYFSIHISDFIKKGFIIVRFLLLW